jgi:signal transduction histidine kinase
MSVGGVTASGVAKNWPSPQGITLTMAKTPADSSSENSYAHREGEASAAMARTVSRFVSVVALLAAAVTAAAPVVWRPTVRLDHGVLCFVVATLVLAALEIPYAHVVLRRDSESFTLGEGVLFIIFALFSPSAAVFSGLLAMLVALGMWRTPLVKRIFNVSQYVLSVAVGAVAAHSVAGGAAITSRRNLLAAFVGLLVYETVNRALVMGVIAIAGRQRWLAGVVRGLPVIALTVIGLSPVGALSLVLIDRAPAWLPLLIVPVGAFFVAQRQAIEGHRRAETTDSLLALGNDLAATLDITTRSLVLADGVRTMLRASRAEVILFGSDGAATRTRTSVDHAPEILVDYEVEPATNPYAHVRATGSAHRYTTGSDPLGQWLEVNGIDDMAGAPLVIEGAIRGVLMAADKIGPERFSEDDLRLLGGIAQLASGPILAAQTYAAEMAGYERLRELDRMKSDFIASVSHELRTPLTVIHGYGMTLDRHYDRLTDPARTDYIAKIVRNTNRLTRLIEGVLAASKWDSRRREDDSGTDLAHVVAEVLDQLSELAGDRTILVDLEPQLPPIAAAPDRVVHVLRNLVENAVKYSPAAAPVTVRAVRAGHSVAIEVVDRGPGIPDEQQARVWDRFYQVDQSSTRRVGGTGLGLYLVKNLTEAVGGSVALTSGAGGSTFRVVFPVEAEVIPFPGPKEGLG